MSLLNCLAVSTINFYQKHIRQYLISSCRFEPSCSEYAKQALEKYGFLGGVVLAGRRLLTCHPFSAKQGFDPLV